MKSDLFADVPDPKQLLTAWEVLTENLGMVFRKWRRTWPQYYRALDRSEVLGASLDAAVRGVMKWEAGKGTRMKTFVLNAVGFAAMRAKDRHKTTRKRAATMDREWEMERRRIIHRDGGSTYHDESIYDTTWTEKRAG